MRKGLLKSPSSYNFHRWGRLIIFLIVAFILAYGTLLLILASGNIIPAFLFYILGPVITLIGILFTIYPVIVPSSQTVNTISVAEKQQYYTDTTLPSFAQEEHQGDISSGSKPKTALLIGYIPYKNPFFIGREEELKDLCDGLMEEKVVVISGMPGIGKTQIAAQYVYRYQHQYKYIIWGSANSSETLVTSFSEFAKRVNLPHAGQRNELIQEVKYWLQQNDGWLLILDNVENIQMTKNDFIPTGERGHIILTTQMADGGNISSKLIEVKAIKEELGALFLLRRSGKLPFNKGLEQSLDNDRKAALEISRQVEGYLLLLDIAGAYIRQSKCSVSDYLKQYMRQPITYLNAPGNDYPDSIMKVFALTFKKIEASSQAAVMILNFCAFLYHDIIPEKLIIEALKKQKLVAPDFNFNDSIVALNTYSLVERVPQTNTISLHRLIQDIRRYTMDKSTQQRWERQTIQAMAKAFPNVEPNVWDYCQLCLPHAQACIQLFEQWNITSESVSKSAFLLSAIKHFLKLDSDSMNKTFIKDISRLLYQVAHYLQARGFYHKAEPLMQQSLEMRKKIFGLNHNMTARAMERLASIYYAQSKLPAAMELNQQSLSIFEHLQDRRRTAEVLNSLASIYRNQGKYKEAEPLYQRALQIRQAVFGLQSDQTAKILNSLAELYRAQGDYKRAEPLALQALENCKQNVPISLDTAQMYKSLSELYRSQGKYKEAENFCKESLKIYKKIVGFNHPEIANCLNRLARFYLYRKEFKVALCLSQKALKIEESLSGFENPKLIYSLNSLARNFREQKLYPDEVESLLKRALIIAEKALGDHPQTAECLINLAAFYSELGRNYQEAESLYLRAVKMNEQCIGPNDIKTAFACNSLARHYRHRKEFLKAELFFQRALEISKVLGEYGLVTARYSYDLAWNYSGQKQFLQAQPYYEQALDTYLKILGPVHSDTLAVVNDLIKNYIIQEQYSKVDLLIQQMIELIEKNSEQNARPLDIRVADIYIRQAKSYSNSQQYNAAESCYKKALMIYLQAFGSKHPFTTEAFHRLEALNETGISDQKTLEEYLQEIGSNYIQISEVLFHLARNNSDKQEYKTAIWYYFRVAFILKFKPPGEMKRKNVSMMLKKTFKGLGYNYLKLGNKEEAKYFFEQVNSIIDK